MKNQKHDDKTTRAYAVLAQLETRYRVRICEHDRTAIVVSGITEKQLSALCRRLHCLLGPFHKIAACTVQHCGKAAGCF